MKKLLGIVVLGLFLSSNAYAFNYLFDLGLSSPGGFGGFATNCLFCAGFNFL